VKQNVIIDIRGLTYSYPTADQPVLKNINWTISSGEFVLVAGPSGAGKSTIVRAINGLVPHFTGGQISGRVEVAGQNVLDSGPTVMSRYAGFVFQNPEAQMVLDDVEEEIAFSLENAALPTEEINLRINEVLEMLDMQHLRGRSITHLSSGERQRVAIATSLADHPPILILDEPTSQLDPEAARNLMATLADLREKQELTIIMTEHRLDRIVKYCDRLTYMDAGRILFDGPIRDALAESPLDQQPPLSRLSSRLGWEKMPLSISEAINLADTRLSLNPKEANRSNGYHAAPGHKFPALQVDELTFSYGDRVALNKIDFSLNYGESVAIVGPNGSGKSTLLKCLVGLLRPDKGEVFLDGISTSTLAVAKICSRVAYLPQVPDDLLFAETVREELEATLANHQISDAENESDVALLLRDLELTEYAESYPRDLSVGQRQRVALGAVSVTKPEILLLDEPTRGLDYAAKSSLTAIWRVWQKRGMALVIVTHDIELAARVADRVIVLRDGAIEREGPSKSIFGEDDNFNTQISRLYPGRHWITVQDAVDGFESQS
jgi:energy-coupling factor transport system ATP-binding protein